MKFLILLILGCTPFLAMSQVDIKTMPFGEGVLHCLKMDNSSSFNTISPTNNSHFPAQTYDPHFVILSYYDENNKFKWKKKIENTIDGVILSDENSEFAFSVRNLKKVFNSNKIIQFTKINKNGNIDTKEVLENSIFKDLKENEELTLYSSFISNSKFYIIYEKNNFKLEQEISYYILELDEYFNFKVTELENSKILVPDWKERKISKIRYVSHDRDKIIYYRLRKDVAGYQFEMNYFDLNEFSFEKEYVVRMEIPLEFDYGPFYQSFYYKVYGKSSSDYNSSIFNNPLWDFEKKIDGKTILESDLATPFYFYYEDSCIYFFRRTFINKNDGSLIAKIELDKNLEKIVDPNIQHFNSSPNYSELYFEEKCSVYKIEFNPKNKDLVYQVAVKVKDKYFDFDYKYFQKVNNEFVEMKSDKNYFIPSPFFAINQNLLEKKGVYNFPKITVKKIMMLDNIQVHLGRKINIYYEPAQSNTFAPKPCLKVKYISIFTYEKE